MFLDLKALTCSGNTVFEPGKEGSHYKGGGGGSGDKEEENKGESKDDSKKGEEASKS
jgi:hypothetical protein